ncbi:MAG: DUF3267 domain-containing protein [Acutalibacteraceae bacterium]
MKSFPALPEGYRDVLTVNLQKNKKLAWGVNLAALVIAAIMVALMSLYIPVTQLFDMSRGLGAYVLRFAVLLVAVLVYLVAHEGVHALVMKLSGTKNVRFGFTGLYAYAGSDDYYDKRTYVLIAMAPVIVWGIVLAVINPLVPKEYFWVVYFVQIANISGAAGDFYVTLKFAGMSRDILVKDTGVEMTVYDKA